jgi:hypothetical protein
VLQEDYAQFTSQKIRFPVSYLDEVSYRPNAHLSKVTAVRMMCHTVWMPMCLKHHPSGRLSVFDKLQDFFPKHSYGKIATTVGTTWIPVQTRSSIRQVSQFKSRRPDDGPYSQDARASDMEIACIKSTVRTIIPLVWTREAFIKKLLIVDVRPSGRQEITVRMRLKNRKEFQLNSRTIDRTVVHPDGP